MDEAELVCGVSGAAKGFRVEARALGPTADRDRTVVECDGFSEGTQRRQECAWPDTVWQATTVVGASTGGFEQRAPHGLDPPLVPIIGKAPRWSQIWTSR
ncbi:hypothetical protein ABZ863_11105 [Saccharomonospora sp. NPDC046836]|uniref:hypothetical protein n=1 Tax=Saccharomonospora sp. NPDC046836 TaxID=3156921 RepID=UPI0033FBD05E